MRCHICDNVLNEAEINYNRQHEEFDPCGYCLSIIAEVFDDPLDEDEITHQLETEWGFSLSDLTADKNPPEDNDLENSS